MNKFNINVAERIPLKVGQNKNNLKYLETKAKKIRPLDVKDLILTPLGLKSGNKLFPCVIGKNGVSKLKREGMEKLQLESIKLWECYIDLIE